MIKTQEELREYLESRNISIFKRFEHNPYAFLIYYFDNKSNSLVYRDIVPNPEVSLRKFPNISKQTQLPVDDFDIVLMAAFNEEKKELTNLDIDLDYHIYFKDEEKKDSDDSKE